MSRRVKLKIRRGMKICVRPYTATILQVLLPKIDFDYPAVAAEIGVANGCTSAALLSVFPQLKLYMVDKYKPGELRQDLNQAMLWAKKTTEFARDRRVMIVAHSLEAAKMIPDESLDFVFIDANHYYDYVKRDLLTWEPKVRPGGWLVGHDYNAPHERIRGAWGVKRAVDEFMEERGYELQLEDHLIWWGMKQLRRLDPIQSENFRSS